MRIEKHFVTFYSPGTFVAETTTKPIDAWDVDVAQNMMTVIEESHHATPYGFRFTTRARTDDELDSAEVAASPTYYVNCVIKTLSEVEAEDVNSILASNMRCNGWVNVVQTTKGWKWTQPLMEGDVVL